MIGFDALKSVFFLAVLLKNKRDLTKTTLLIWRLRFSSSHLGLGFLP